MDETYEYILERCDKKGSDFFQLPHVINVFQTQTYDFIDERIPFLGSNQRLVQDLQGIMEKKKSPVLEDPENVYMTNVALPEELYHLVAVQPIFKGNVVSRDPKLIRHGRDIPMQRDPHNKPTVEYPLITQYSNYANINSGYEERPISCYLVYIKKPTFAKVDQSNNRVVNLPNGPIEAIITKVIKELVSSKGDPRTQSEFVKELGQRNIQR